MNLIFKTLTIYRLQIARSSVDPIAVDIYN